MRISDWSSDVCSSDLQRLQQPSHSETVESRSEQHRHAQILTSLPHQVGEHGQQIGRFVHQKLLEELVVMIGELFEHVEAIGRLALCQVRRNLGPFGGLAGPIMKGAFEREVDESGDLLAPRVLSADW